ncbi:MAG: metal-dependent hydrolase [Dehalococcoidaceae bacterium]|nr:metal-dependent hydrolase [Dehalococcoidaceae bacterium]
MLLLAHTGITVGCVWLAGKAAPLLHSEKPAAGADKTARGPRLNNPRPFIDYRLLFIGSILPDLIDKPLGIYFLADELSNGRIYAHTLLFALILLGSGLAVYLTGQNTGGLVLAGGVFAHLMLDSIWLAPGTFLWPLYGLAFDKYPTEDWLSSIFEAMFSKPAVFIPEIIGLLLLLAFFWQLFRKKRFGQFLKSGRTGQV